MGLAGMNQPWIERDSSGKPTGRINDPGLGQMANKIARPSKDTYLASATAMIKDLENGSKTVSMYGKPVALRDKSFIATSTGNEPATESFKMGEQTGCIKGKAYFASWSPKVFVEGENVRRHMYLMTHNHKS